MAEWESFTLPSNWVCIDPKLPTFWDPSETWEVTPMSIQAMMVDSNGDEWIIDIEAIRDEQRLYFTSMLRISLIKNGDWTRRVMDLFVEPEFGKNMVEWLPWMAGLEVEGPILRNGPKKLSDNS